MEMDFSVETSNSLDFDVIDEDVEEKMQVRVDSCLLCAEPALTFDQEGNLIKSETILFDFCGKKESEFNKEQLFLSLCKCFGLSLVKPRGKGRDNNETGNQWGLQLHPFPFCDSCEQLLESLSQVYSQLEELRTAIHLKTEGAEASYQRDNLYEKHDKAYLAFRKDALRKESTVTEPIKQKRRRKGKVSSGGGAGSASVSASKSNGFFRKAKCSRAKKRKDSIKNVQFLTESINQEEFGESEGLKTDCEAVLKKRGRRLRPSQRQRYTEESCSDREEEEKRNGNEDEGSTAPPTPVPKVRVRVRGPGKKKKREKCVPKRNQDDARNVSKCKDTVPVRVGKNRRILLQRSTRTLANNQGYLERDGTTGSITYSTGFGNRFGKNRTELIFTQVEGEDGIKYECTTCLQIIPLVIQTRKQQQLFRQHYLVAHTNRFKCRLCPHSVAINYCDRTDLFTHLSANHNVQTMERYHAAIKAKAPRAPATVKSFPTLASGSEKKDSIPIPKEMDRGCKICGMPLTSGMDLRSREYRQHLLSHMNEEEKTEALLLHGRRYKELVTPPTLQQLESGSVSQCQSCGKFITQGDQGLRRHLLDFHPEQVVSSPFPREKEAAICNICGVVLSSKTSVETHMKRVHPDGKWDGPFKCKFPGCPENWRDEPSLKIHVEVEHGQSEEAVSGVLCRLCGRVLATAWALKLHGLVHSGERPHKCHFCPMAFPLKSTLKQHLSTKHAVGAQVWKCEHPGCDKLFPNRIYFRIHMRDVHGVFVLKRKNKRENLDLAHECRN
ncbi:unnamed protein product [Orchesella dallaii]|uniref:C2H2-type domain-containing protein n=1 Tax=Orchesella dallaii TaxID=48710 RepID=A0ABP1S9T1_9HEXA